MFLLAVDQCMAIRVKQSAIFQRIRPTIHTPDDVMIVPTGFTADRITALRALTALSQENAAYLPPITQLVLHPFDPQFLPLQFLRRIVRMVTTRKTLMAHDCGVS